MNNELSSKPFSSVTASLAAIISDIPIVSIAGSTLSEITTTTTSTTTTPTPTPTPTSFEPPKAEISPKNPMSDAAAGKPAGGGGGGGTSSGGGAAAAATTTTTTTTAAGNQKKESSPSLSGKSEETATELKTKKSEAWEETRLKDLDDIRLKNLLEEAYSYKNPRDKENKSQIFLDLLQKAENENENEYRAIISSSSHNRSGGSLQDLFDAERNESLLDCEYNYFIGGQRNNRRQNHNSRQKKFSSVSSRPREGGSLPTVPNYQCSTRDQLLFMNEVRKSTVSGGVKLQRRNAKGGVTEIEKECELAGAGATAGTNVDNCNECGAAGAAASSGAGDCIIEMDGPMMDIQQQQKILQAKQADLAKGQSYYQYENMHPTQLIPRITIGKINIDKSEPNHDAVEDRVHFHALDSSAGLGALNSGTVSARAVSTLPYDENYKACRSVLGDKPDKAPLCPTKTISRECDENGNSVNEGYTFPSGGRHPTAVINTIGAPSSSATMGPGGSIGTAQAKAKAKKKAQKDNTKTVNVTSFAGYRGNDPVEVLVKYIESEVKQGDFKGSNSGKFGENSSNAGNNNKKKERKKDKEKQHKMKKSNSLEELRSCAKIEVDELKHGAATTESGVMMRSKGNNKNGKNNSASTVDINKNFESGSKDGTVAIQSTLGSKTSAAGGVVAATQRTKGERRSWGTEELQYLGESNITGNSNNGEDKAKDKKSNKNKEKEADKDTKDRVATERTERNATEATTLPTGGGKNDKIEKPEKCEKTEKSEKRKKSESNSATIASTAIIAAAITSISPPATLTVVDIVATNTSEVLETAEFHVVTKKKKPKKQRVTAAAEDCMGANNNAPFVGNYNRTHNFNAGNNSNSQKSTLASVPFAQQQARYNNKHYNPHGAVNNHAERSAEYFNHSGSNHAYYQQHHQHHQQPQQQQQQSSAAADKSRRKSTSSVPPSEKSDSSDLDSVHSLPIESTTKNKQRHKNSNSMASGSPAASGGASKNSNSPAPISYADIARTNKELQQAAAAAAAADKWPTVEVANGSVNISTVSATDSPPAHVDDAAQPLTPTTTTATAAAVPAPKSKTKKSRPDFPELVATSIVTVAGATADGASTGKSGSYKPISYSQSLTAVHTPASPPISVPVLVSAPAPALVSGDEAVTPFIAEPEGICKMDAAAGVVSCGGMARQQQQHQQQLQKSKSVEHDSSYSYNSSNLDQQYPALERTVKRHSASNMCTVSTTGQPGSAGQFNFAAAAKQQVYPTPTNAHSAQKIVPAAATVPAPVSVPAPASAPTTSHNNATAVAAVSAAFTPAAPPSKKSKEKSPTAGATAGAGAPGATTNAAVEVSFVLRKYKKDKQLVQLQTGDEPHVAQKSTTATQTHATSGNGSGKQRSGGCSALVYKGYKPQSGYGKNAATANVSAGAALASNRPAVIILNDDRGSDGVSNEFTFGDFNEDELRFFDDTLTEDGDPEDMSAADSEPQVKGAPATNATELTYFNDSGASSSDVNNITQQVDETMLLADTDASSPNASFAVYQNNNQSSDSGVYTASATGMKSKPAGNDGNNTGAAAPVTSKDASNKLNTFLNTSTFANTSNNVNSDGNNVTSTAPAAVVPTGGDMSSTNNGDTNSSCPPPQQLETCNDIETAIIAAARAAAEQQSNYQPQPQLQLQHQQQHFQQQQQQPPYYQHTSNSFSNSSSFSSSSSVSADTKYSPHSPPPQKTVAGPNHYSNNHQQRPQSHEKEALYNNTSSRSRSNSDHNQRESSPTPSSAPATSLVVNIQHKEFDIHFIPPTMSTAFSSLQHNEIIVDFIGSAWEEVAKATKFYDGQ